MKKENKQQIIDKISLIKEAIKNNKNRRELQSLKADLLKEIKKIKPKDGYTPKKGIDYFDGEKGESIKGDTVIVEKIIEKTEVIKEQPIIKTEVIKEVDETKVKSLIDLAMSGFKITSKDVIKLLSDKSIKYENRLSVLMLKDLGMLNTGGTGSTPIDLSGLVPYIGATTDIDLGLHNLTTTGTIKAGTWNGGITTDFYTGFDTAQAPNFDGNYGKNILQNAGYEGVITKTITGPGAWVAGYTDDNYLFDSSGENFNLLRGADGTTSVTILVDVLANVAAYGSAWWQPFVKYRQWTAYGWFKTIVVEFSTDNVNWFTASSGKHDTTDPTVSSRFAGLWVGTMSTITVPSTIATWRYARFTFSNLYTTGIGSNPTDVYFAQLGVRHYLAPFHTKYANTAGDRLYGNYQFTTTGTTTAPLSISSLGIKNADNTKVYFGTGDDANIGYDGSNWNFKNTVGGGIIIENDVSDGDISFKVNDGGVDTSLMYLDGSTSRVGILTDSPSASFHVNGSEIVDGGLTVRYTYMLATPIIGIDIQSNAIATLANPVKMSPSLSFRGQAWNTTVTAASKVNCMVMYMKPVSGTTTSGTITFANNTIDGTANTTELFKITSGGNVILPVDSQNLYFGTGTDMSILYNGTVGRIDTSLVAASDLQIDCGTDKTLVLDESVWEDIQFVTSTGKVPAANYPTWEAFTTNTEMYAFSVDDKIQLEANEPPHGWSEGTVGYAHIHTALKTAQNTGANRYAKFELIFAYADYNGVWTEQAAITQEQTIPTGSAALQSFLTSFTSTVTLTGLHIGSQITVKVRRIAATGGTEYADDVYITQVGCHVEKTRIGSRTLSAA